MGGILVIVLSQPPHSVCDSQMEILRETQRKFLYKERPKSKVLKTSNYQYLHDRCRDNASPGGCYELFQEVKTLLDDLETVTHECAPTAGAITEVKKALWDTEDLLVRLAWGGAPPAAYHAKFGWLDRADVTLFCKLKTRLISTYGEPAWNSFREKLMLDLPGAKDLARNQSWDMSLFSENCARYP